LSAVAQVDVAVAGGGAAGFFSALHVKCAAPDARVVILEKSREFLAKVAISGGGRCNVTHACFDPARLIQFYPRGGRELRGPFHRFQPRDTVEWFTSRGVDLKTEADGRMFPVSDSSADIVNTLLEEARALDVRLNPLQGLASARRNAEGGFDLELTDGTRMKCRVLILATGGNRGSGGLAVAESLGHTVQPPVPSLFSFHVRSPMLEGLAGIAVDPVRVRIPELKAEESGPLLITHKGLSGPAILKLSAWQARALAERNDAVELRIQWLGAMTRDAVQAEFNTCRLTQGGRPVIKSVLGGLPRRLWERLVHLAGMTESTTWARMTVPEREALLDGLTDAACTMRGKTLNKEEFVTCGGVNLKEVDMKTFQSRLVPGLFFAGEVLDIDGVTGGFNFQAAWTGGCLSGTAAGASFLSPDG
jgi:predicted Rossmann fold flavoprotein